METEEKTLGQICADAYLFSPTMDRRASWEAAAKAVEAEVLRRNAAKPAYYLTAERKPTPEDASKLGYVLAAPWGEKPELCSVDFVRANPEKMPVWAPAFKPVPAPLGPDEAAFEAWAQSENYNNLNKDVLRRVWQAALAHRDKKD